MNWRCLFGFHNWEHKTEYVLYSRRVGKVHSHLPSHIHHAPDSMSLSTTARVCKSCYKKQIVQPGDGGWIDYSLNKDELRDKKIKELGL